MKVITLITTALLIAAGSSYAESNEPDTIWHAAVYQEEVIGDLNTAVKLYKQIADTSDDREAVSGALLQLLICYSRMGEDKNAQAIALRLKGDYIDLPKVAQAFKVNTADNTNK